VDIYPISDSYKILVWCADETRKLKICI